MKTFCQKEKAPSVVTTGDFCFCSNKPAHYQRLCTASATPRLLQAPEGVCDHCEFLAQVVAHLLARVDQIKGGAA